MALSLGVRKGSKIAVGDHEVQVKAPVQTNLIVVSDYLAAVLARYRNVGFNDAL
jgi:hypothetical protein